MRKAPVSIIAEIGINHNGSLSNCYKLVDAAAKAGCDHAKFQFFKADELYPKSAGRLNWKNAGGEYKYGIYRAVQRLEMPRHWVQKLMVYCKEKKINFLASIFGKESADYLVKKGMRIIKLSSSSVTNLPLIEHCARYKLPLILSTGGAALGEIEEAARTVNKYHNKLSLLHCSLKYPTRLNECNLGAIETLRYAFPGNRIGYSDHTQEVSRAAVQAVYLGARIIEKHITLDKKMAGPDHFFSLEPQELKAMVVDVRKAEEDVFRGKCKIEQKIYGTSQKTTFAHERYLRNFCFTSIFSEKDIRKGQRIRPGDISILRPGKQERGLDPEFYYLFREYKIIAAKDLTKGEPITWRKIFHA